MRTNTKNHPVEVLEYDWPSMVEGETTRLRCSSHTCESKDGKALTITRTSTGCIYNCYRCGLEGFPGIIGISSSPSGALRRIKEMRNDRRQSLSNNDDSYRVRLPYDFVSLLTGINIPPAAPAWLYQCELDDNDIYKYNLGYSYRLERVIMPIYESNELIAWQGRDIYYNRNKELYKKGTLEKHPLKYYTEYNTRYFKYNNIKLYFKILNKLKKDNIIIVEDILSCIKLYNRFSVQSNGLYDVIAMLNSTIHDKLVQDLNLRAYNKVYVWIDYDARVKSIKAARKLQTLGIDASSIRTFKDPKLIPYKELTL